jgi:hypothetical protein
MPALDAPMRPTTIVEWIHARWVPSPTLKRIAVKTEIRLKIQRRQEIQPSHGSEGCRLPRLPAVRKARFCALAKAGSELVEPHQWAAICVILPRSIAQLTIKILILLGNYLGNGVTVAQQTLTLFV